MSSPRILLVDDERQVSRMLRTALELSGRDYIVIDAPSGEEALLELARGPVDLLVADLRLPGISGLDLLGKLRQLNPEARAIMITGDPSDEVRQEAEALGVVAFLAKPIGTNFFLEAVDRAIQVTQVDGLGLTMDENAKGDLKKRLRTMRRELGAEAAFLVDLEGTIIVHAGSLSDVDIESTLRTLTTAFSAGLKVSSLMGSVMPVNFQFFDGDRYDFYVTNVGAYYSLMVAFDGKPESGKMGAVAHYGRRTADDLLSLLSEYGVIVSQYDDESPEVESTADADKGSTVKSNFVALNEEEVSEQNQEVEELDSASVVLDDGDQEDHLEAEVHEERGPSESVELKDAEQFWDKVVSEAEVIGPENDDVMTYDEARRRGLLSDDS